MSYSEWLSSQSTEFQNKVLGKKRAVQFRNGEYKADKYREFGKPLSLSELNQTDNLCLRGENVKSET